jgi:DNA-binding NtrC family response regulator
MVYEQSKVDNMKDLKQTNILLVDDESALVDILAEELGDYGINIFKATSGNDAYEVVKKNKIDIILSDIKMPNGNGIELLERVISLQPAIKFFFAMTGFADVRAGEIISKGALKVYRKPVDCEEFVKDIEGVLQTIAT